MKKTITKIIEKVTKKKIVSNLCEECTGVGRIPQKVEYHYVSCEKCKGTGQK